MNKKITVKERGVKAVGTITIKSWKAGTKELLETIVQKNLIMQGSYTGKDLLCRRLIGDTTYTAIINYGAIGTGSTTPAVSDTQLATESARTTRALELVVGNNQAQIQFFFPDVQLANTTYREFGTFIDGSNTANTGRLFNRALFSTPYVKVVGTDTTVEVDIVFT